MVEVKEDEKTFFIVSYTMKQRGYLSMRNIINIAVNMYGLSIKRCWYYLKKWCNLGFYDYGVSIDLGWFYSDKLPDRYKYLMKPHKLDGYETNASYVDELVEDGETDGY